MSNPSCNNQTQVYWNGTSFFSATAFFSDAALSSPSPDGFYAFGGFVREISNGILLAAVPCESCIIPCGDPFYFNGGSTGEYNIVLHFRDSRTSRCDAELRVAHFLLHVGEDVIEAEEYPTAEWIAV